MGGVQSERAQLGDRIGLFQRDITKDSIIINSTARKGNGSMQTMYVYIYQLANAVVSGPATSRQAACPGNRHALLMIPSRWQKKKMK